MSEPKQLPDRAQNMKRLRETQVKPESTPLNVHVKKAMKTSANHVKANEKLDEQYHWDSNVGTITTAEKRDGSQYVKYVHPGGSYRSKPFITTGEPMLVTDSCMFEDGNLGVERPYGDPALKKKFTETNPKKAKFELTLSVGTPESLEEAERKKLKESQPIFLESVKDLVKDMWTEGRKAGIYDDCLGERPFGSWLRKGKHFIKPDGSMEFKRPIQGFRGDPNPVRYWKKVEEGHYERFYPAEIPIGSLVTPQYIPKPYCFNDGQQWRHGTTAELGRDLIVHWMPTPRTKEEIRKDQEAAKAKKLAAEEEKRKKSEEERKKREVESLKDVPIFD
tara:strand:+ start:26 stop:1027 length:1002 start_codon:yes stop_codon:yes gene_type:complete